MKVIATILIAYLGLFSNNDYVNTEAKGWVERVIGLDSLDQTYIKHSLAKRLSLVLLPIKNQVITKNGNRYLKCYLVNNTDTTSSINRSGATISDLNSEVRVKNKWVSFQTDKAATCTRSFWIQKLNKKYSLDINFVWQFLGEVTLPLRLVYKHQGKLIYSNQIDVKVPDEVYHELQQS
jgi:hypothetical protein